MSLRTILTADQFKDLPDDGLVHELDEGELISRLPASKEHGDLGAELFMVLRGFVKEHLLGKVYQAGTGFRITEDTVRAPDVAFVRKERLVGGSRRTYFDGSPDLAAEIFSPSDSVPQLMRKVRQYLRAGTHTVWLVYPKTREIHVLEASGRDCILRGYDVLDAPELLPGFSVPARSLFE